MGPFHVINALIGDVIFILGIIDGYKPEVPPHPPVPACGICHYGRNRRPFPSFSNTNRPTNHARTRTHAHVRAHTNAPRCRRRHRRFHSNPLPL